MAREWRREEGRGQTQAKVTGDSMRPRHVLRYRVEMVRDLGWIPIRMLFSEVWQSGLVQCHHGNKARWREVTLPVQ